MLRPTFLGFETAKRGLTAAQKGLDIAGQNLANWDSVGYTRQRVTQVAVAPDSYRTRYASSRAALAGQGVEITGIDQTRDVYLDKRFRDESGDVGYYEQSSNILNDIQTALNEYDPKNDTGLRTSLLSINDALQNFSTNAYSETHANIVASAFKNLTQTLQQISGKLQSARGQQIYDLEVSVQEVNKKFQQIANLNQTILEAGSAVNESAYFGPNELLDERNVLLDELAQYVDLSYSNNADGTVTVTVNGQTVVSGGKFDQLDIAEDEKTGVVNIRWLSTNQNATLTTGALKASSDYINGRGPNLRNPGESTSRGFLYYQDQLDAFAQTLVSVANRIIPEAGADGQPLRDPVTNAVVYRKLLGGLSDEPGADGKYHVRDDIEITADNLSISDEWAADSGYIIYLRNPDDVPENVGNYALALSDALVNGTHSFDANGVEFKGTFLDYVKSYASTLAEDVSYAENRHTAAATIVNTLEDSRDSVSGVVVDEEVANVMLYQKSLSAASRVMTAMDEALDVIVNKMGLVGR